MYDIFLLRHGESIGNFNGRHQGHADYDLTEKGRAQARALAGRWQREGRRFDLVISSPLKRARQTAEILSNELELPLHLDPEWMEYDIGRHTGLEPAEAQQLYPEPAFMTPYDRIGETGESRWEIYLRAGRAVMALLSRPPGSYLVVSHGGFLNLVMYAILGIVPHANFLGPRFPLRNTAFIHLTYEPAEHKWRLLGTNDHLHWQDGENETLVGAEFSSPGEESGPIPEDDAPSKLWKKNE
jgi:2,3-bisphosphoglycerate-dependent phosphoglycerate mutase